MKNISVFGRLEVKLVLLAMVLVLVTSSILYATNEFQRRRAFNNLPDTIRQALRPDRNHIPTINLPANATDWIKDGARFDITVQRVDDERSALGVLSNGTEQQQVRVSNWGMRPRRGLPLEDQLQSNLLVASGIAALVGIVLGVFFARRIAHPIEQVAEAADRLASGDLSARTAVPSGNDETALLARNFNRMAASLQQSEHQRKDMIADIAHELRTPLAVMQGRLEALQDGVVQFDTQEVDRLHNQTLLLARLVNDLRTISLADAGQLSLNMQTVHLEPLLQDAIKVVQVSAQHKGIKLVFEGKAQAPVLADPIRLSQVIHNLLSNAISYTPEGSTVGIKLQGSGFAVWDTGKGIAPAALGKVFERFYREEGSRSRATGGSGLGLAIVKAIVELHGGSVKADNRAEGGAEFVVSLPST